MFLNWISRCWGGMGINTQFQKARINCCIADWTVPFEDDILILITSFQDKNPQIPGKTAINTFLSHLQTDQERSHPAFLLKHLYVLDHCVQEMTALDTIGYYYNSNLTNSKSMKSIDSADSQSQLRNLVNTYYAYLKTKARNYGYYEATYFSKYLRTDTIKLPLGIVSVFKPVTIIQDKLMSSQAEIGSGTDITNNSSKKNKKRQCTEQQSSIYKLFEKQNSYNSIFDVIQKCQEIQKCILLMNKSYVSANRRIDLIKYIFITCLCTFIKCYVIVTVGMKFLFRDFTSMSLSQLERFIKAFQHFNNQYTGQFIKFVESNKNEIQIFKEINYNELTYINKDGMKIILAYQDQMREKELVKKRNSTNKIDASKEMSTLVNDEVDQRKIIQLPQDVQARIKENMKIFYKPRRNMQDCLQTRSRRKIQQSQSYHDNFQQLQLASTFFQYNNFYHQDFSLIIQDIIPELIVTKSHGLSRPNHIMNSLVKLRLSDVQRQKSLNRQGQQVKEASSKLRLQLMADQNKQHNHHGKSVELAHQSDTKHTHTQVLNSRKNMSHTSPTNRQQSNEIKGVVILKQKLTKNIQLWQDWQNIYESDLTIKN